MPTEDFPNAPLAAIPDYSLTNFAGGSNPKSQFPAISRQNKRRKVGAMKANSLGVNRPELLTSAQFAKGF